MDGWNPWRALRDRGSGTEFWFADLGSVRGLWTRSEGRDHIYLSERLGRSERREVLTHELIHAERGIGHGAATAETMVKEEHLVRVEAWLRLVPPAELQVLIAQRVDSGSTIGPRDVAERFDVSERGAAELLDLTRTTRRWEGMAPGAS